MHEMQTAVSVSLSVCRAAQLGYTVQQQLNRGRETLRYTEVRSHMEALHMSRFAEAKNLKFCEFTGGRKR